MPDHQLTLCICSYTCRQLLATSTLHLMLCQPRDLLHNHSHACLHVSSLSMEVYFRKASRMPCHADMQHGSSEPGSAKLPLYMQSRYNSMPGINNTWPHHVSRYLLPQSWSSWTLYAWHLLWISNSALTLRPTYQIMHRLSLIQHTHPEGCMVSSLLFAPLPICWLASSGRACCSTGSSSTSS